MNTTQKTGSLFYVVLSSVFAGIAGMLFGYDTGVISGALIFLQKDFHLNPEHQGMIVSSLLFGAAIGALGIGKFADKLGRRRLLFITAVLFIVGSVGLYYADSLTDLYVYRFVLGISIGVASFAAPSYISEISPAHLRGRLVSLFQLSIVIGILGTYLVNYILAEAENPWRLMFLLGMYPAIVLLIGLFFLPDSPRWLLLKGKEERAIRALKRLRGSGYETELNEIRTVLSQEKDKRSNWRALFQKMNSPIIIIAILIFVFQQLSGINAIIYYAPEVFISAGFGVKSSLFATVLVGVVNLLSTILGLSLLDKLGRRPLMITGYIIMTCALALAAFIFGGHMTTTQGYIGVVGILVYIFAFAISSGLMGWLIISELFPLNIRGEGAAIGATSHWVCNILVSFSFPILLQTIGIKGVFAMFAFVCFIGIFYFAKYLPETKNVSLETIEKNLMRGKKSKELGQVV